MRVDPLPWIWALVIHPRQASTERWQMQKVQQTDIILQVRNPQNQKLIMPENASRIKVEEKKKIKTQQDIIDKMAKSLKIKSEENDKMKEILKNTV